MPFAFGDYWADQFGDHIAGLAHYHRIADENAFAFDLVCIVQRGARHRGSGHIHRVQYGHRCDSARAPDLHHNIEELGVDLLGRVFVGDGPTRRA